MGTIENGKIANLVLLDNNPLTDLAALRNHIRVFIKGVRLDREILDRFGKKIKNSSEFHCYVDSVC